MIKGSVIKQRDMIIRPFIEYRKLDALNYSMIKKFESNPVDFYQIFKLGKKKQEDINMSLIIGSIVDFYIIDCYGNKDEFVHRFNEKFALIENNRGSGQVFDLADILFQITKDDTEDGILKTSFDDRFTKAVEKIQSLNKYKGKTKEVILLDFIDKSKLYFDDLIKNMDKTAVDLITLDKAESIVKQLKTDPFTKDILFSESDTIENFPKLAIEWEFLGMKCKSEIDLCTVDHSKKTIYLKDLKTTYDNGNFKYVFLKNRYDLQACFYYHAIIAWSLQVGLDDYTVLPMDFIVADTSVNNKRPLIYKTSYDILKSSMEGFKINDSSYRGLQDLVESIKWAEETENWDISKEAYDNNGIINLKLK